MLAATRNCTACRGDTESAQGRPPNLPSCGQEDWTAQPTRRNSASSGSRDEWPDTVARDGFGQAMRLALGWWRSRSTAAVARPLGKIVSNRAGCRFEVTMSERFS
jgi:hypothetical protein